MRKLELPLLKTISIKNKLLILQFILIILISGCSNKPLPVIVNIPDNMKDTWNLIIKEFPLPAKYIFIYDPMGNMSLPEITLKTSFYDKSLQTENLILLNNIYLVPTTNFWDPVVDINITEIENYNFLPLEEVKLPLKGLSIESLFPGDSGYPAYKAGLLELVLPENYEQKDNVRQELLIWFGNIKKIFDQSNEPLPKISWLAGVGDMMVQRGVETILISQKNGIDFIFGDTLNVLQDQDLMLGNLEGSITYTNTKTAKSYNFKFNPKVLPILKEVGFNYFSLTNNHIYDYGEKGFIDTLKYLKEAEISTSGAGHTKNEAIEYSEMTLDNNTIRVLSIGAYPRENNGWDGRTMAQVSDSRPGILFEGDLALEAVKNMASESSFDVLMIHGGVEWRSIPEENQKNIYRDYLDAGADIIFGSHPHVLQGMEEWKGKLIAYSLGNFIFPGMGSMKFAEDSMILSVGIIDNEIKYIKPIPVKINNQRISIDKSGSILDRFKKLSTDLIRSK